jgi:hypothetical protein
LKELPKESRISERNTKQQLKEVVVKFKKKRKRAVEMYQTVVKKQNEPYQE